LVQVCEQMPEGSDTRDRELSAVREAQSEQLGCRAVVVTRDEEAVADSPHGAIEIIPVWKWLLES
jgi:predicted AAA+ superfamily ATPase